jgi:DNA mismatch repair protein MutS
VAALAGIPKSVVAAAKRKLSQLEQQQVAAQLSDVQPDMFMSNAPEKEEKAHPLVSAVERLQVDDLTPKQALDLLYELKSLLN